jgi:heme/copper-type cytochrome/quinol oxidase subunit 1
MPRFSFWVIRFSLVYLLIGFSLGGLMLTNKGQPFASWIWRLLPVHIELLLFGFVVQFVMGIAYWIFPRFVGGSRGNEQNYWISIVLLNLAIWVISCAAWFMLPGLYVMIGRVLEGGSALLFLINSWRRVKPSHSPR